MREIKFRIWDKIGEVFRGNLCKYLINADTGELEVWSLSDLYDEWYNTHEDDEHLVIQQHTGLQDKNGTPIYEGDIVVEKITEEMAANGNLAIIGKVYFAAGTFMIDGDGPLYDHVHSLSPDVLEDFIVAGNIFENPELLKQ